MLYSHESTASKLYGYHRKYKDQENIAEGHIIDDIWAGSVMRSERLIKLFQSDKNKDRTIALQFSLDDIQMHKIGSNDV